MCACPRSRSPVAWLRIEEPRRGRREAWRSWSRWRWLRRSCLGRLAKRAAGCWRRSRDGVDRLRRPALGAAPVPGRARAAADRAARRTRARGLLPRRAALVSGAEPGDARARARGDLRLRARASRCSQRARGRWQPRRSPSSVPAGRRRSSADEQQPWLWARSALAAALSIPLILRVRSGGSLVAGMAAVGARRRGRRLGVLGDAVAREAAVNWQSWDFSGVPVEATGRPVRVGLELRRHRVSADEDRRAHRRGPERARYWRTSTLDLFASDHWFEDLLWLSRVDDESDAIRLDRLAPPRAALRGELARAAGRGEGARRRSPRRRRNAGRPRLAAARDRVPPVRRRSARSQPAGRGTALPRLELRARSGARGARGVEAALPERRKPLSRGRRSTFPAFATPGRESNVRELLSTPARDSFAAYASLYQRRAPESSGLPTTPYAAVLALESWFRHARRLRLRRAAAARGRPAARRLRDDDEGGVLPALRGRDGGDAAHARDPRSGRGRLHERAARGRQVGRHRPRGARLGRSLVRRAGLGAVRSDSGAGDIRQHLLVRVGLGGGRRRAPSR